MVNRNIDLPSKRSSFVNEIEQPLRRKFRSERNIPIWILVLAWLVVATVAYAFLSRIVDDQAHAAEVSRESTYSSLCTRYIEDSSLTGTAAEETINQICK